jgi:hypothetical protein
MNGRPRNVCQAVSRIAWLKIRAAANPSHKMPRMANAPILMIMFMFEFSFEVAMVCVMSVS